MDMSPEKTANFIEELEEIIDKHVKNRPKVPAEVVEIVRNCIRHFEHSERALFVALVALGHCMKHSAEFLRKTDNDMETLRIMSDPIIKMIMPFAHQIMTCKRLEQ